MAGVSPVSEIALKYVRDVGYVFDELEQASKERSSLDVPYWTQDWLSCSYVFQPTETAEKGRRNIVLAWCS